MPRFKALRWKGGFPIFWDSRVSLENCLYATILVSQKTHLHNLERQQYAMNTHANKTRENKSRAVANNVTSPKSSNPTFHLVNNTPEAIAQRKLRRAINNGPSVPQLKADREMPNSFTAQRKENLEGETLQGKFEPIQKKENNTGLPDNLKSGIENLSGYSMDGVKVHYNSNKPAQLQAHAYAQGTDIHIASGQEKHLPHEAWHVVQQKQGRVQPTIQMKGKVNVNDDAGLEKEVDMMGTKALMTNNEGVQQDKNPEKEILLQPKFIPQHLSRIAQRTKKGNKIDFVFNKPPKLIEPKFNEKHDVFGAERFFYDVTFEVDEQGEKNSEDYLIGEFRQYYKGGLRVFGQKLDWKNDWVEDTLQGNDHYGYRGKDTHVSKYIINNDRGDKLEMNDKPEVEGVNKPDEIAYNQEFKGEVVAVDAPSGNVKEVLETQYWHIKGVGTRDKNDNIYYGLYHGQIMQDRIKSKNKSKRKRKEAAGKYEKPESDG